MVSPLTLNDWVEMPIERTELSLLCGMSILRCLSRSHLFTVPLSDECWEMDGDASARLVFS